MATTKILERNTEKKSTGLRNSKQDMISDQERNKE